MKKFEQQPENPGKADREANKSEASSATDSDAEKEAAQEKEIHAYWEDKFGNDPTRMFEEEELKELEEMPERKRVAMFGFAAADLRVTPSHAEKYFEHFPDHKESIADLFLKQKGVPHTSAQFNLFGMIAGADSEKLRKGIPDNVLYKVRHFANVAERREGAPDHLLDGYENPAKEKLDEYGAAAEGFQDALDEAAQMHGMGNRRIDPMQMFTDEFEELPEEEKAALLRDVLGELQYMLVFDEVNNSAFTQASERKKEERQKSSKDIEVDTFQEHWEVGHSMIFDTYQPSAVYDQAQKRFQWEMDTTAAGGGYVEEYPHHRLLLATLDKMKEVDADADANTDILVEFWDKNRNPIFANGVVDALSEQNPQRASQRLMDAVKREERHKHALASILYRLELGNIGISKEGVEYLGRLYDLQEFNNPEFFARRLDPEGRMGVFDDEKKLRGMFDLGDLTQGKEKVTPEVYDLTLELLFTPHTDETEEGHEQRKRVLEEFREHYFDFYGEEFRDQTGVHFNNLPLQEQSSFMQFVHSASEKEGEQAMRIVTNHKEAGLRTFLALNYDEFAGDKLVDIAESISESAADLLFRKFEKFVDMARETRRYLLEEMGGPADNADIEEEITESVLRKGVDVIDRYSKKAREGDLDEDSLLADVARIQAESALFLSSFKTLKKRGSAPSLESIRDVEFERVSADDIPGEDKEEMRRIYMENYGDASDAFRRALHSKLERFFEKNARFYQLTFKGAPKAFVAFSDLDDTHTDAGAFNVAKDFQNHALGQTIIESAIRKEAQEAILEANCLADTDLAVRYIEEGFVGVGVDNTEDFPRLLNIEWNERANDLYEYKHMPEDELLEKLGQKRMREEDGVRVRRISSLTECDHQELKKGDFALTRLISVEEDDYLAVYEPRIRSVE